MTVALVMCAGGRAANPVAAIESVRTLIDSCTVIDTGVAPEVRGEMESAVADLDGGIFDDPFDGTGPSFTRALARAKGTADWLLHLHSDEVADVFPTMGEWLADDPSPDTDAWMVEIVNPGLTHRLPRLLRGDREWRYEGVAHEYLQVDFAHTRGLYGLTLFHNGDSTPEKFEYVIEHLKPGHDAGEPRAVFYTAEALRDLGRIEEAIAVYTKRAAIRDGWEEERWYAEYQAAKLSEDVEWLLFVHDQRPHRSEPLHAAAHIVYSRGTPDVLFLEHLT